MSADLKNELDKLEQKVSQLETRDAEDKFELLKEIHRIRENTVKNLVAIVGTLIAIFSAFGFFYLLPQVVTNVIKTSADSEIRALGESLEDAKELEFKLNSPLIVLNSDTADNESVIGAIYNSSPKSRIHVQNLPSLYISFSVPFTAWSIYESAKHFPDGTIFLSLSNPGATMDRLIILEAIIDEDAAEAITQKRSLLSFLEEEEEEENDDKGKRIYFIGHDNGSFDMVVQKFGYENFYAIDWYSTRGDAMKNDIVLMDLVLAQTAGNLANSNITLDDLGRDLGRTYKQRIGDEIEITPFFLQPQYTRNQAQGAVVEIDHFGNVITNLSITELKKTLRIQKGDILSVTIGDQTLAFPYQSAYGDVGGGEFVSLPVDGYLQLAVNYNNLAELQNIDADAEIVVKRK